VILAIDPGPELSAYVEFDGSRIMHHGIDENAGIWDLMYRTEAEHMAIEMVASYGMPVGEDVFLTVWEIGRHCHHWECCAKTDAPNADLVYRKEVKHHLCGTHKAKDANIRQALIDRFGPGKEAAIGRKATPGPLYGLKSHEWSALAVAVTWWDTIRER